MIHLPLCQFLCQLLWTGLVSCAVYHIVPSPDHHCPVESCFTLSSFVTNASLYVNSNTSLIFQPGNHIIHSRLNVSSVVSFSMVSYSQPRAGITCDNYSEPGFIFNAVNYVHVYDLNFSKCYWGNNYHDFKLITITASSLVLMKCNFEDNEGTGVINATNSNITIVQSTFKDNHVRTHFEMLAFLHCNITIVKSTFINNTLFDDRKFKLLSVNFGQNPTVVSTIASTLTITSCEFRNNNQSVQYFVRGSCIIYVHRSDIYIYDTKFISNKRARMLYAEESVINTVSCTFKHNHGSAMDLDTCKVDISNSDFINNEARALSLWNSTIHIHGSEFKENTKMEGGGGAIFSSDETIITFSEVYTLADNQAEQGGAIYLGHGTQCFLENGAIVTIANNTAFGYITEVDYYPGYGGGVYFDRSNLTLYFQSMLQILENGAAENGGGIYLNDHSNIILHSHSILKLLENKATKHGGGISAHWLSAVILGFKSLTNVNHTSNSTIYFYGNRAREGGGLYLRSNSTVHVHDNAFLCLNNTINFVKNSADYGGAVCVYTETT